MQRPEKAIAVAVLGALLLFPANAFAYLGYDYIEFGGAPIFNSPVKIKVIDDRVKFSGQGYGGNFSLALHPNWHIQVGAATTSADSGRVKAFQDPETSEPTIHGRLKTDTVQVAIVPGFNYRVAEETDLTISLGALWGKRDFKLDVTDAEQRERVIEGALDKEEWGVTGGAGVRSMLWRGLEGFGDFRVSSVSLLENEIFFNLGLRYHFWETAALGAQLQVSTSSFIGLWLGLRVHYDQLYERLSR